MTTTTANLIADVRGLIETGRRVSRALLERLGIPPCLSCSALPWDCPCPTSVRMRNGWDHHDLNDLHGGRPPVRGLPSSHHVPDAGRELLGLIDALEQLLRHGLVEDRPGLRVALAQAEGAAKRAGLRR